MGLSSLLVFLAGCASTSGVTNAPAEPEHVVVGAGTADDRTAINASNQRVFDAEHATSSDAATSSDPSIP